MVLAGCKAKTSVANEHVSSSRFHYFTKNSINGYICATKNYIFYTAEEIIFFNPEDTSKAALKCSLHRYDIKEKSVVELINGHLGFAINGDRLVFINEDGIFSCDFNGEIDQIYDQYSGFISDNKDFYFLDVSGYLYKMDAAMQIIGKFGPIPTDNMTANINIHKDKIYYTSQIDFDESYAWADTDTGIEGYIYEMNLDGTENRMICNRLATQLFAHGNYLYYISDNNFHIERLNLETMMYEEVSNEIYYDFNIKDGYIYCSNYNDIYKLDLSGNIITSYGVESPRNTRISFANDSLFFRKFANWSIWEIDLATGRVSTFFEGYKS